MTTLEWNLPLRADAPPPIRLDTFPSWLKKQDPTTFSENDRLRFLEHFIDHLDTKVDLYHRYHGIRAPKDISERVYLQQLFAQDARIQNEIDRWLKALDWSANAMQYGRCFAQIFAQNNVDIWRNAALQSNSTACFNIQMLFVLQAEYGRTEALQRGTRHFFKKIGYQYNCPLDAPPGDILRHYLQQWMACHEEAHLLDCQQVLEMLHPRPLREEELGQVIDAMFHGFVEHRRTFAHPTASIELPSLLIEDPSPP